MILSTNKDILKDCFIKPLNLDLSNTNLRKNFNKKAKSLYLLYILLFILILINSVILSKINKSSVNINEIISSPGVSSTFILMLIRMYYISIVTQIAVTAFSYDFLAMYVFLHIQVYMEHIKNKIDDIEFEAEFSNDSTRHHVNTKCAVKHCILLHQHVIW